MRNPSFPCSYNEVSIPRRAASRRIAVSKETLLAMISYDETVARTPSAGIKYHHHKARA